jgi:hypothetical protein
VRYVWRTCLVGRARSCALAESCYTVSCRCVVCFLACICRFIGERCSIMSGQALIAECRETRTRMFARNSLASAMVCLLALTFVACEPFPVKLTVPPTTSALTPSPTPPESAPTPIAKSLEIQLATTDRATKASIESLLELTPGNSTLQDIYVTVGYPVKRKDFADDIALLYPSLWVKSPHVVVIDGKTGKVLVVSIENISKPIFSLANLSAAYGRPVSVNEGQCLFFDSAGIATLMHVEDDNRLLYVQRLPKDMTFEQYKAHQCYWHETQAFVP